MIQSLIYLLVPFLLLKIRLRLPNILNPVIASYAIGIVISHIPLIDIDQRIASQTTTAAVAFAIALLLLGTDFLSWLRNSKTTLIASIASFLSIVISAGLLSLFFSEQLHEIWKTAGVLVGVYTGSLPNLAAIGIALSVEKNTLILIQATDILLCGVFSIVLLSPLIKKMYGFLTTLPAKPIHTNEIRNAPYSPKNVAMSFFFGILIVGSGAMLSKLVPLQYQDLIAIFVISTLAVILSLNKKIRSIPSNFDIGEYFLLMFCLSIGSQIDFSQFALVDLGLVGFTAAVITLGIVLHMAFCKVFKIDRDTAIITMTAAVYSPAFVPPVSDVLENRQIILSGITAGLAGLALGNYLGIALAYLLKWMLGF